MNRAATREMAESARAAVRALAEQLELAEKLEGFEAERWDGSQVSSPVLQIDDFSAIPFLVDITGVEEYQHRARLRARSGDIYAAVSESPPGYEVYCHDLLGLEPVEILVVESEDRPLCLAEACSSGAAWDRLAGHARRSNRFAIHPFMGIEEVWSLARRLRVETGVPVTIIAPPPPVMWVANDKALFGEVVRLVLGDDWLVETFSANTVAELAGRLVELAGRHTRVALKRLRCASAMGNAVFDAAEILRSRPAAVEHQVASFLERTEWQADEAVLAVAWEETAHSPSTQLWIPPEGSGAVRLDGVYDQILQGSRRIFVGSRPSTLPAPVLGMLADSSLAVASGLQALGYAGRCSFDFLVVGDPLDDFEIRFTECNGRWGGTSTPMALLDRLMPGSRPPYRARDFVHGELVGASFTELLQTVGEQAWERRSGKGRYLFYNTGPLKAHGKLDVIALGVTQEEADAALEEELPRLWGLR